MRCYRVVGSTWLVAEENEGHVRIGPAGAEVNAFIMLSFENEMLFSQTSGVWPAISR